MVAWWWGENIGDGGIESALQLDCVRARLLFPHRNGRHEHVGRQATERSVTKPQRLAGDSPAFVGR